MYYLSINFDGAVAKLQYQNETQRNLDLNTWKDNFLMTLEHATVTFESKKVCELKGKELLLKKYEREGKTFQYRYHIYDDVNDVRLDAYYKEEPELDLVDDFDELKSKHNQEDEKCII